MFRSDIARKVMHRVGNWLSDVLKLQPALRVRPPYQRSQTFSAHTGHLLLSDPRRCYRDDKGFVCVTSS